MVLQLEMPRNYKVTVSLGFSVALCIWLLQSTGLAALIGLVAFAVVSRRFPRNSESSSVVSDFYTESRWLLTGLIGGSALLWAPVILTSGPAAVFQGNVASMSHHLAFNRSPYSWRHLTAPLLYLWEHLTQGGFQWLLHSLSYQLVWIVKYGLIVPVWIASSLLAYGRKNANACLVCLLLLCQGLAYWNRQDMLYLNYLTPLFYICLVFLIRQLPYKLPMTAVLLVTFGLQHGFGLKETSACIYPIDTPRGRLWSSVPFEAVYTRDLFEWCRRNRVGQSRVLAYPYAPSVYTLGYLSSAVRSPVLVPLLYSHEELIAALNNPRLLEATFVIRQPLSPQVLEDYPTVNGRDFEHEGTWFDGELLKRYTLVERIGPYEIYRAHSGR